MSQGPYETQAPPARFRSRVSGMADGDEYMRPRKKRWLGMISGISAIIAIAAFTLATLRHTHELASDLQKSMPYIQRNIMLDGSVGSSDASVDETGALAPATASIRSLRFKNDELALGALPHTSELEDDDIAYEPIRRISDYTALPRIKAPDGAQVEILDWFTSGMRVFARGKKATVIDIETGLSFNVRRFGGEYHADSYPLTKADTAVMKKITGEWSWNRRAIWVVVDKRVIAASMNCMPHMVDANPRDGFPGHFCIHFYQSLVHKTAQECPVHQAMVIKAYLAGQPSDHIIVTKSDKRKK